MGIKDNAYLLYALKIISEQHNMSTEKKEKYRKKITEISHRQNDPYLKVTVIGNTSAGKSTFINGLIKHELLKANWGPTTVIPTEIYYHSEPKIKVFANTFDGKNYELTSPESRNKFQKIINEKLPKDTRTLLKFIATNNSYASIVKSLRVFCQSDPAMENICIVDTPGVNSGAESAKGHESITENFLQESADASIILMPAIQTFDGSFERFLKKNAMHLVDEAVFVVTQMDLIAEDEREENVDTVRKLLSEKFVLKNPTVYGCCAMYCCSTPDEEDRHWNDEFDIMRKEIFSYIEEMRKAIIKRQVRLLLIDILAELDTDLQNNISLIGEKITALNEKSVENLKEKLTVSKGKYLTDTLLVIDKLDFEKEYKYMFSNIYRRAKIGVTLCKYAEGTSSIEGYMNKRLPDIIITEQEKLRNRINRLFRNANDVHKEYIVNNIRLFQESGINPNIDADDQKYKEPVFSGLNPINIVPYKRGSFGRIFGSLDSLKDKTLLKLKSDLDEIERKNLQKYLESVEACKKSVIDNLDKIEKEFYTEYQKKYLIGAVKNYSEGEIMNRVAKRNEKICKRLKKMIVSLS